MTAMNKKILVAIVAMIIGMTAFAQEYRMISISRRMLDVNTYINVAVCADAADNSKALVLLAHYSDGDGASIQIGLATPMSEAMTLYRRYTTMPMTSVDNIIMTDWSRNAAAYKYDEEGNWYTVQYNADDMLLGVNAR